MKYPNRKWGLYSPNKWAGKTTFIAASMKMPAIVADYDDRFPVQGKDIILLSRRVIMNPLDLIETVERLIGEKDYQSIVIDTVTKLYQRYSRQAAMQISQNRVKNKASTMVDKSNAMSVISTIGGYAPDIYYVWHQRPGGINAKGEEADRHKISDIELHTIHESVNVDLLFVREGNRYGVTVENARDIGSSRVNRGFTLWDEPDNFWEGFADKLERLIYTSFRSQDDAIRWAMKELGNDDPGEIGDIYAQVKAEARPKTADEMWVAWIQAIDGYTARKSEQKPVVVTKPPTPKQEAPAPSEPASPVEDDQTAGVPEVAERQPIIHDFEELESASQSRETASAGGAQASGDDSQEHYYEGGTAVAQEDVADFLLFQAKFNRIPYEEKQLHKAVEVNTAKGTWHE